MCLARVLRRFGGSQSNAVASPAVPLLQERKHEHYISINGSGQPDEKVSSNDVFSETLDAERKLEMCLAMIKSQIRTRAMPKRISNVTFTSMLGYLMYHMINSSLTFDKVKEILSSTKDSYEGGDPTYICGDFIDYRSGFYKNPHNNFFEMDTQSCRSFLNVVSGFKLCTQYLNELCDGPGMWNGYIPTMIFLMALAVASLIVINCCKYPHKTCLDVLPPRKAETLKRYALKYGIQITRNTNLDTLLKRFSTKINDVKNVLHDYRCREMFAKGMNDKTSPVSLMATHPIAEPNLCHLIFEMSGHRPESYVRNLFFLAAHRKNEGEPLYSFLNELTATKDENGERVYDRDLVVNELFSFAGIRAKA